MLIGLFLTAQLFLSSANDSLEYLSITPSPLYEPPYYDSKRLLILYVTSHENVQLSCRADQGRVIGGCYFEYGALDLIFVNEKYMNIFFDNCGRSIIHHELMHLKYRLNTFDPTHDIHSDKRMCKQW